VTSALDDGAGMGEITFGAEVVAEEDGVLIGISRVGGEKG